MLFLKHYYSRGQFNSAFSSGPPEQKFTPAGTASPDFGVDMRIFTMRNASQKFIDIKI
nr:MAG TPA: hypothetical protein [Caudoviricetes sp.]DAX55919.1 MAG TPA: hypothetical protein [Caudoviricetes sp.]